MKKYANNHEGKNCKCEKCGRDYIFSRKSGHRLKTCNSCNFNSKPKRDTRKQEIVKYLGGACIICGYNKCMEALDAHHIDPKQKEFRISGTHGVKWEIIQRELDKCVLLCANCHREYHAGLVNLPQEITNGH